MSCTQKPTRSKRHRDDSKIEDAYDLKQARRECRLQRCQGRYAFAYMYGGRLRLTFSATTDTLIDPTAIYRGWLNESAFADFLLSKHRSKQGQPSKKRILRCIAFSLGDTWEVWNEIEVCRMLCNPRRSKGKGWAFIPIEKTILDPDRRNCVWSASSKVPVADRCMTLAEGVLSHLADLFIRANELLPQFSEVYESLDADNFVQQREVHLARLIRDIKNAALRLMEAGMALAAGARTQDEGIAVRQGLLMGTWLAQAEAIITNESSAKLAAVAGEGKKTSKFWTWVNQSELLAGKSAKEAWLLLDGKTDPDRPSKKLKVVGEVLLRGDGKRLKEASFRAKFQKH